MSSSLPGIRWSGVLREAWNMVRTQRLFSVLTVVVVGALFVAVLLTSGRTVAAEENVLSSIDSVGTRSIIIRAKADASIDAEAVERIKRLESVEAVTGFSERMDMTKAGLEGGALVGLRYLWGDSLGMLPAAVTGSDTVAVSTRSKDLLALEGPVGELQGPEQQRFAVTGTFKTPGTFAFLEPLVVASRSDGHDELASVTVIVVTVDQPGAVAVTASALGDLTGVMDPSEITISTSEQLADLRTIVQGQLGEFGRSLVLVILLVTAALVAVLMSGFVMMRRKDFGRRRALGASGATVMGLVLGQLLILTLAGSLCGSLIATAVLLALGDRPPGLPFYGALAGLTMAMVIVAGLVQAALAAKRDPLKELRVP